MASAAVVGSSDSDGNDDPMSQVAVVVSDTAYASPTTPLKASYDDGDDRRSSSNNKRSSSKHRTLQDKKRKSKTPGIAKELLWSLRYLIPLLLLQFVAGAMVFPLAPGAITNAFAQQARNGNPIDCQSFGTKAKPEVCIDASSTSALVQAVISAISSGLAFLTSPLLGSVSDAAGRKPFMIFTMILGSASTLTFVAFYLGYVPVVVYLAGSGINNAFPVLAVALAYIADLVSPERRAAAFGVMLACLTLATVLGPGLAALLPHTYTMYISGSMCIVAILYTIFILPESLPRDLRTTLSLRRINPIKSLGILFRTSLFRRLTACVLFQTLCSDGVQSTLIYFLQQQYNFTAPNIALLLIVLGISGTVVQGAGIAPLARLLGYKWLLVGGLVCTFANILLFAVVHLKWFVYVQIGTLLALGTVCFPAISAIKSVNVSQSEQGTVQGALYGIRQLAGGGGPLLFSLVYKSFDHRGGLHGIPFFPEAPFVLGAAVMLGAIGFALSLPNPEARMAEEQQRFVTRARARSHPMYLPSTPRRESPMKQRAYLSADAGDPGSPLLAILGAYESRALVDPASGAPSSMHADA